MSTGAPEAPVPVLEFELVRRHYHPWHKTDIAPGPGQSVNASRMILQGDVHSLCGWSIREPGGVAGASFRLHDGSDANGSVLANCDLNASESSREAFGAAGIHVATGRVWLEVLTGAVEGVLYWR